MGDHGTAPRCGDVLQTMWEQTHQQLQLSRDLEAHLQDMLSAVSLQNLLSCSLLAKAHVCCAPYLQSKQLSRDIFGALERLESPQKRCAWALTAMQEQQRSPKLLRLTQRAASLPAETAGVGRAAPSMHDCGKDRLVSETAAGGAGGATPAPFADESDWGRVAVSGNSGWDATGGSGSQHQQHQQHQHQQGGGGRLHRSSSAITSAASCPPLVAVPSPVLITLCQQAPPEQQHAPVLCGGSGGGRSTSTGGGGGDATAGGDDDSVPNQQRDGRRRRRLQLARRNSSAAAAAAVAAAAATACCPSPLADSGRAGSYTSSGLSSGLSGASGASGLPGLVVAGVAGSGRLQATGGYAISSGCSVTSRFVPNYTRTSWPIMPASPPAAPRDPATPEAADFPSWHAAPARTPQSSFHHCLDQHQHQQQHQQQRQPPSFECLRMLPAAAAQDAPAAPPVFTAAQQVPPADDAAAPGLRQLLWAPPPTAYLYVAEALPQQQQSCIPAAASPATAATAAAGFDGSSSRDTCHDVEVERAVTASAAVHRRQHHLPPPHVQQQGQAIYCRISEPPGGSGLLVTPAGFSGISRPPAAAVEAAPYAFTSSGPTGTAAPAPAATSGARGGAGLEEAGEQHLALLEFGNIGSVDFWNLDLDD